MAILLRIFMVLGILLIFIAVISGMGASDTKPLYSQHLMTAGLISLGLWVVGGLLVSFFSKDPMQELDQKAKEREAKKTDSKE